MHIFTMTNHRNGSLAVIAMHAQHSLRSIALRPHFSEGLPFSFSNSYINVLGVEKSIAYSLLFSSNIFDRLALR